MEVVGFKCFTDAVREVRFRGARPRDPLRTATHQQVESAFKGTGFKPSNHFVTRLKHPRLQRVGVRTFGDVERIFRKGEIVRDRGELAIRYRGVKIIVDPGTRRLVNIRPY